jgi:co-chaperonin GroES (HSP10)
MNSTLGNEEKRQEWRKARIDELNKLPIEEGFEIPKGLFIPFGNHVLIKEVIQGEVKSKSGIITATSASKTVGASVGVVYAIGEDVFLPIFEGMRVYYEPSTMLRVYCEGEEYVQIPSHLVFGAAPPSTYLQPYVADFIARRRESRLSGTKAVMKHDHEEFEKKVDIHENGHKTNFAVTKDFKKDL